MLLDHPQCLRWHGDINIKHMFCVMLEFYCNMTSTSLVLFAGDDKVTLAWISLHPNVITMFDIWFVGWLCFLLVGFILATPETCSMATFQGLVVFDATLL